MRRLIVFVVGALLVASCATDDATTASSAGSFCEAWADLQPFVDADELPDEATTSSYLEARGGAGALVPEVLEDDWAAIVEWDEDFVAVLYSVDFDPAAITDTIVAEAFGSVDEAEAAERRHQAAVDTLDRWSTANCEGSGPSQFTFCERWTDIHQWIVYGLEARPGVTAEDAANALADAVVEADASKPADVPEEWAAIVDYHLARHDVLVTVGFDESLISDELLADAFGSVGAARSAEAAAAAAVPVVQEWSVTGCGDFCVRSSVVREALGRLGSLGDDRGLLESSAERGRLLRDLELGDRLVPEELRSAWDDAADEVRQWVDLWEQDDFDPNRPDPELPAPVYREGFNEIFLAMDEWVDEHCAGVGGPGLVEVELPRISGAAGGSLAVVLGEVGSSVDDLVDADRFARGLCEPISRSPFGIQPRGDGTTEPMRWPLRARPAEEGDNPYLCEGWQDERAVEPGTYGLVVAQYPGLGLGSLDAAARPSRCLTLEIEVAGDTLVRLPELPSCDVELPEGQGWLATEPVDPSLPGVGTLSVSFPEDRAPAGAAERDVQRVEVTVVALPAGTTLNEIGREQVAPSGAACVLFNEDRRDPEQPTRPVVLPVAALAPGFSPGCLDAVWLSGSDPAPGQARGDPPAPEELNAVLLAPGTYDLRFQAVHHESEEGEQSRCATVRDVVVDGDTVVEVPAFEECP